MPMLRLCAVLVVLAATLSCATVDPLVGKVPPNSWGIVRIERPESFLADLKNFLTPLKDKQGRSLAESVFQADLWKGFPVEVLDWKQPWLASIQTNKNKKPGFVVFVPLVQIESSIQKLKDFAGKRNKATFQVQGNYAVVSIDLSAAVEFPLESAFDLSRVRPSSTVGNDGVVTYWDVGRALRDLVPQAKSFAELMENVWEDLPESDRAGLTQEFFVQFGRAVDQLAGLQFQAKASEQGLFFETKTDFGPGTVQKTLASASGLHGTRDYLKYLSSDALVSGVFNLSPQLFSEYVEKSWDASFQLLGIDAAAAQRWKAFSTASIALVGNRSAFNFDLRFDRQAIREITEKTDFSPALVRRAFEFDLETVTETKDGARLLALYRDFFERDAGELLGSVLTHLKVPVTVQPLWSEHADEAGFAYRKLSFTAKVDAKAAGKEARKAINQALEAFLPLLTVYFAEGTGKVFATMGTNSFDRLRALAKKDAVDAPWSASSNFSGFAKAVSDTESAAIAVSTERIVRILKELIPDNDVVAKLPDDTSGILIKGKVLSSGDLEGSLFVALKDIVAVVQALEGLD